MLWGDFFSELCSSKPETKSICFRWETPGSQHSCIVLHSSKSYSGETRRENTPPWFVCRRWAWGNSYSRGSNFRWSGSPTQCKIWLGKWDFRNVLLLLYALSLKRWILKHLVPAGSGYPGSALCLPKVLGILKEWDKIIVSKLHCEVALCFEM